jgi:hypothetical protein
MSSKGILGAGIVVLTMIVGVHSCVSSVAAKAKEEKRGMANKTRCRNEDGNWGKISAGSYRDNAGDCIVGDLPSPPKIVPAEKPWTFRTLEIPIGGLTVQLYSGWKDFAFGGDITITTPGGQVLKDQPGVNHQWGLQPDGMYVFLADPAGSKRSVQILNRW